MNYVEGFKTHTSTQLISHFFTVIPIEQSSENIIFELDLLPHLSEWQHKPASICGLILDSLSSLAGHKCSGHFDLAEYETNILCHVLPNKLKIVANISLELPPHAGFFCQIFAADNYPLALVAETHGTLVLR